MDHDRIARVVIGLTVAILLAVVGALPRVQALERRLGVSVLISAGLPFLGLGAIFRLDSVGILTPGILVDLQPAFDFGLGWIGFVIGMQLDIRRIDALPRELGRTIVIESLAPMAMTALLCGPLLYLLSPHDDGRALARDLLVLAACASASAPVSVEALARSLGDQVARMLQEITTIDEVVALAALGLVAVVFRPAAAQALRPAAWLLVSLGLGTVLGTLSYVLLRGAKSRTEELALLLGAVTLSAGMAVHLALSVPVVCAIAGALLANLPTDDPDRIKKILVDIERPIYLVFLVVVGARWRPDEWQGWLLAPAFVLARVVGKAVGSRLARRVGPPDLPPARTLALALTPQSPIAIVVIVSAAALVQDAHPEVVRWAINAVIIGGVLTEVVVRLLQAGAPGLRPVSVPPAAAAGAGEAPPP